MKFEDIKPEVYGITFGIFSLALLFTLMSMALMLLQADFLTRYINDIASGKADLLPIPVFFAVVLFFLREMLDLIKNRQIRLRKLSAYKLLIAEELELNHGSYHSLKSIFEELENTKDEWDGAYYEAKFKESGNLYVHVTLDGDLKMASPARQASLKQHDQLLVSIAEIDNEFYIKLRKAYLKVVELEHLYNSLIKGLRAEEFDEPYPHTITKSGFLGYGINELARIYTEMNELYIYCTGNKLEKSRLR